MTTVFTPFFKDLIFFMFTILTFYILLILIMLIDYLPSHL